MNIEILGNYVLLACYDFYQCLSLYYLNTGIGHFRYT